MLPASDRLGGVSPFGAMEDYELELWAIHALAALLAAQPLVSAFRGDESLDLMGQTFKLLGYTGMPPSDLEMFRSKLEVGYYRTARPILLEEERHKTPHLMLLHPKLQDHWNDDEDADYEPVDY